MGVALLSQATGWREGRRLCAWKLSPASWSWRKIAEALGGMPNLRTSRRRELPVRNQAWVAYKWVGPHSPSPRTQLHRLTVVILFPLIAACSGPEAPRVDVLFVNTAPDLNNELEIDGRAERVALSQDGQIWLGTGGGQIVVGDSVYAPWRHVLYPPIRQDWSAAISSLFPSVTIISFFTPDTVIALGLGSDLHRTVDGGESWDTVAFGDASFTDAAFTTASGRGWIGGGGRKSSSALFTTDDFGVTWRALPAPFDSRISSIYMEDADVGVVGGLWNKLAYTTDGGMTWTAIATPFDQGIVPALPSENEHMLDAVAIAGDRIIVRQGERAFQSRRGVIEWSPLAGGIRHFAYDCDEGRLYGLNEFGEVQRFDDDLRPTRFGQGVSRGVPVHMAAHAGRVVVLEREGALLEATATRHRYGFPLSDSRDWRLAKVRLSGDRLWGVSSHQVYTSLDMGRTWDRVGFTPTAIRSFLVRSRGDLLLWDGHGRNLIYDPVAGTLEPHESLRGYDVVDVLQVGKMWVAFGGRQYETMGRVEVGRTYFAGQFEGSRENGFVLVSNDEGETWRQIDEWEHGGVANVFVDPASHDIVLVSYLGGVRRLDLADKGYSATDAILPSKETWHSVPYVEVPSVVYFEDADHGYIDGWIHHLGYRRYTTSDGGRSWREERTRKQGIRALPASNGYVILRGSEMAGGTELVFRSRELVVPIWKPEPPARAPDEYPWAGITDISIDDEGRLVALVDGVVIKVLELPEITSPPSTIRP